MEVIDISNKYTESIQIEFTEYLKDFIKNQAKAGSRIFNINTAQWNFTVGDPNLGIYKLANAECIKNTLNFLKEEGFTINDAVFPGQVSISW